MSTYKVPVNSVPFTCADNLPPGKSRALQLQAADACRLVSNCLGSLRLTAICSADPCMTTAF